MCANHLLDVNLDIVQKYSDPYICHVLKDFRDCTDAGGPGYTCKNCHGHSGKPCRVSPRSDDPKTGDMCGTCSSSSGYSFCLHSPYNEAYLDKHPTLCGLGIGPFF